MEEEKQLDFNQPFLSVRRFSPKVVSKTEKKTKTRNNSSIRSLPLPVYKSDLKKSGPVSHPGTIPFIWEHTPGRPKKNDEKLPKQPPRTPNLPPCRVIKHQHSDQVSKGSSISSESATKQKILKEFMQEKDSSDSDDAYEDALDTLSISESFSMNCSASGFMSVLDDDQEETQPFGSFSSSDQQARDFMINRFLPAAKAMVSESSPHPQYISPRKQPVEPEEPRPVKEVVLVSKQRYSALRQIVLSQYAQDFIEEERGEDENVNNVTKVCGLFPRFCFLNPFPELRMEGRVLSSATTHNGTRKEQARTLYSQFGFREGKVRNSVDPQRRDSSKLSEFKSHSNSSSSPETSLKDDGNSKEPSTVVLGSSKSLDLPRSCCPDRSIDDKQMPSEHETDFDKNLLISSHKVAQCKKTQSDNSVMRNQQNFDGSIQNPASWRRPRLAGELDSKILLSSLPLPKAPSESWLKRTLPTISSSNVTAKLQPATTTHDPKWERIVKSSEELRTSNNFRRLNFVWRDKK